MTAIGVKNGKLSKEVRRAIQQAHVVRENLDTDNAVSVMDAIKRAKSGLFSAQELSAFVSQVMDQQRKQSRETNNVTGICSYSGFSGEKTGFAMNAFSSNMTSGQKPRTNRDVEASPVKIYKGKTIKSRRAMRELEESTRPKYVRPKAEGYTAIDVTPDAATIARREAIKEIYKANKDRKLRTKSGTRAFGYPDAVEIYLSTR